MDGVLVVDKPPRMTSHDVVRRLRKITGEKRVGHLGTLDPMATGVLPMVVGRYTRLAQFFLGHERSYRAAIRFGFATDSYDSDGEMAGEQRDVSLDAAALEAALGRYRGSFSQMPPPVSAKKIGGVRAYKLARDKRPVTLEPAEVTIHELELEAVERDTARIRMSCSAGTYVRSLAHDLGRDLGCGAHIAELRRTSMGEFNEGMARTLEQLEVARGHGGVRDLCVPGWEMLPHIPTYRVNEQMAVRISHGRDFRISPFGNQGDANRVKVVNRNGQIIAVAEARMPRLFHPMVVL